MAREITPDDVESLNRASEIGVLRLLPCDTGGDVSKEALDAAIASVCGTQVLVRMRAPARFVIGALIVLEIIDAPRIFGVCRECGCEDDGACGSDRSPCYWVEPDLCSNCAPRAHPGLQPDDRVAGGALIARPTAAEVQKIELVKP